MSERDAKARNTDGAPPEIVWHELVRCAESWEPDARIIGNIRAADIVRACRIAIQDADSRRRECWRPF